MTYRFVDHTADVGAEIEARTLAGLFSEAALAFTDAVTRLPEVRTRRVHTVSLAADDLETLLVDWLQELLYLFEVDGLLVREADVKVREDDGEVRLEATLRGESYDPRHHRVKVLVKGVTYHGLEVTGSDGAGWHARVIFDI